MRVGMARFSQESNSFSPVVTDLEAFERIGVRIGADFDVWGRWPRSGVEGFVKITKMRDDVELVPLLYASAGPGGPVTQETYEYLADTLLAQLEAAGDLDALFLNLHGAMAAEHHDDPEGLLLQRIRAQVGDTTQIAAYTDHHACITELMVANADLIVGNPTQPHNHPATGEKVATTLYRILDEDLNPVTALRKIPLITHQEQYLTSKPPMKTWFELAREIETRPGVISVSTYPMQPWLDVAEGGYSAIVTTDGDLELADEYAKELARLAWDLRHDLMHFDSVDVAEAVRQAEAAPRGIVVMSDTGDSVSGGSAGDSNIIIAEMLAQNIQHVALVPIIDEPAALAAAEAGEGAAIDIALGRQFDPSWGDPIAVTAEVLRVTTEPLPEIDELAPHDPGIMALLKIGNVHVGVTQFHSRAPKHPEFWELLGVDVRNRDEVRAVVVKTASNFQHYADLTEQLVRVNSPGHTQSRVTEFEWKRLPRPIFPIDEDAELGF
ncbi:MAG: M81 family metallopeptidase [Nitriliruptoraceae bacterium]